MARVTLKTLPEGLEDYYNKVLEPSDRYTYPSVRVKRLFTSRASRKGVTQKSLMVELSPDWDSFSDEVKSQWGEAGKVCNMTGWRLFIQDTARRWANDIPGFAEPSKLYQSSIGRMEVSGEATGLIIEQLHPQTFYTLRKVSGTRSQYEPRLITENLSLPVKIGISYFSDLTPIEAEVGGFGACPFGSYLFGGGGESETSARFYITIYSSYQGLTIENNCVVVFELKSGEWKRKENQIVEVKGVPRSYSAFIEIKNARGKLLFDNIEIFHSGSNFCRDPFCNSIQTTFTKAYYQIPRHWIARKIKEGAYYRSVYHGVA